MLYYNQKETREHTNKGEKKMTYFTNWLEIDEQYTWYCMDCEEEGIEPLNRKEWYKEYCEAE